MPSRVALRFTPQNLLLARRGREGTYPLMSVGF
jgi:hypothetical protein